VVENSGVSTYEWTPQGQKLGVSGHRGHQWIVAYGTWVSRCLLALRMMEVVVTTGAIRCAKLQSNHHHQQINIQLYTGRMPFLWPNQQCQSTEGIKKLSHSKDLLTPGSSWGLPTLSLCTANYITIFSTHHLHIFLSDPDLGDGVWTHMRDLCLWDLRPIPIWVTSVALARLDFLWLSGKPT